MNKKIIIGLVAAGVIIGGAVIATKSQQSTNEKVLRIATQNNISTFIHFTSTLDWINA